jgi:hypothetical protein
MLILAVAAAAAGCGKKKEPPVAPQTNAVSQPAQPGQAESTPQATQPVTTLAQSGGQVDLPELQRCVIRWVVANHRRPANFEDFAATAGVPIPPPPAGKKYILTPDLHVKMVDR